MTSYGSHFEQLGDLGVERHGVVLVELVDDADGFHAVPVEFFGSVAFRERAPERDHDEDTQGSDREAKQPLQRSGIPAEWIVPVRPRRNALMDRDQEEERTEESDAGLAAAVPEHRAAHQSCEEQSNREQQQCAHTGISNLRAQVLDARWLSFAANSDVGEA